MGAYVLLGGGVCPKRRDCHWLQRQPSRPTPPRLLSPFTFIFQGFHSTYVKLQKCQHNSTNEQKNKSDQLCVCARVCVCVKVIHLREGWFVGEGDQCCFRCVRAGGPANERKCEASQKRSSRSTDETQGCFLYRMYFGSGCEC